MRSAANNRILGITPADGWNAVYLQPGEEAPYYVSPLACWALVETEDEDREIVGMDAADFVDFAENSSNFYVYVHTSEITDEMREEWARAAIPSKEAPA